MKEPTKQPVYWSGPVQCDLNRKHELKTTMYDAKSIYGPWGTMCAECFPRYGIGLGTGKGQKYEKQEDGKWKKVEG